jgi:hypothetical protein
VEVVRGPISIDVTTTPPDLVIPGSIGPTCTGPFGSAVGAGAPPTIVGAGPDSVASGTDASDDPLADGSVVDAASPDVSAVGIVIGVTVDSTAGAGSAEPLEHAGSSATAAAMKAATNIVERVVGLPRMGGA